MSRNDATFASEPLNQQALSQRLNDRLPIRQHLLIKLLRRHRPANQITLRLITAERVEHLQLLAGFDPSASTRMPRCPVSSIIPATSTRC